MNDEQARKVRNYIEWLRWLKAVGASNNLQQAIKEVTRRPVIPHCKGCYWTQLYLRHNPERAFSACDQCHSVHTRNR